LIVYDAMAGRFDVYHNAVPGGTCCGRNALEKKKRKARFD
jgi:hypothetical protein